MPFIASCRTASPAPSGCWRTSSRSAKANRNRSRRRPRRKRPAGPRGMSAGAAWAAVDGADFAFTSGVLRVLDDVAQARLTEVRELLGTLRDTLTQFGATADDLAALASSIRQLDELF